MAGAGMMANGDYGLATYPWDLTAKTNAAPANQKTSLIEVGPSPLSAQLLQLLSLSTAPAVALGMTDAAATSLDCIHLAYRSPVGTYGWELMRAQERCLPIVRSFQHHVT